MYRLPWLSKDRPSGTFLGRLTAISGLPTDPSSFRETRATPGTFDSTTYNHFPSGLIAVPFGNCVRAVLASSALPPGLTFHRQPSFSFQCPESETHRLPCRSNEA